MSKITYGTGASAVTLDFVDTRLYERTAIMDGPTYLYTRHILGVVAIYNPELNSPFVPPNPNFQAPVIDIALRHKLMLPRQKLLYTVGTSNVIHSPLNGLTTDANNGPLPLYCHVEKVHGKKTFKVYWVVQTDINECPQREPPIVLSHRWTMDHDIDEHFFTTRTIRGHAILRTDHMLAQSVTPDQYRPFFIHPVPSNFKRTHINVTAHEDGNALDYVAVDTEQPFVFDNFVRERNVTKIEAYQNFEEGHFALDTIARTIATEVAAATTSAGTIPGLAAAATLGVLRGAEKTLPTIIHTFLVRVWGNRDADRGNLELVAWNIIQRRREMANIPALSDKWCNVSHDIMGKWVEVSARFKLGPVASDFATLAFGGVVFGTADELTAGITATTGPGMGKGLSTSTVRGTWVGELVAQALQEPCEATPNDLEDQVVFSLTADQIERM